MVRPDWARDIRGMILLGEPAPSTAKAGSGGEPRTLLKTFRDEDRAGPSSGLIRRGSRASAENRTRPQLQVTDRADLLRTNADRLGKCARTAAHPRAARKRPSDKVSDNRHGQRWTSANICGWSVVGHACCSAGSPRRNLASGRRGQWLASAPSRPGVTRNTRPARTGQLTEPRPPTPCRHGSDRPRSRCRSAAYPLARRGR